MSKRVSTATPRITPGQPRHSQPVVGMKIPTAYLFSRHMVGDQLDGRPLSPRLSHDCDCEQAPRGALLADPHRGRPPGLEGDTEARKPAACEVITGEKRPVVADVLEHGVEGPRPTIHEHGGGALAIVAQHIRRSVGDETPIILPDETPSAGETAENDDEEPLHRTQRQKPHHHGEPPQRKGLMNRTWLAEYL